MVVLTSGMANSEIKWDWLWQITGPEIREALPYYRALCWVGAIVAVLRQRDC